jgi:hypothetical protein
LGACATACCSGCPHSRIAEATHVHREFSLAATV